MKDITSVFPNNIDTRWFMTDIDLEYTDLLQQYLFLIKHKQYGNASELLRHSDAFYYGSKIFNMFENRLFQIENFVVNKEDKKPLGSYSEETPKNVQKGVFWIS